MGRMGENRQFTNRKLLIIGFISIAVIIIIVAIFVSTNTEETAIPPSISHENSVEYYTDSYRLPDGRTLLTTTQRIYSQHLTLKEFVFSDTLPNLGTEKTQTPDGERDTIVNKEFDIYFQMKGIHR